MAESTAVVGNSSKFVLIDRQLHCHQRRVIPICVFLVFRIVVRLTTHVSPIQQGQSYTVTTMCNLPSYLHCLVTMLSGYSESG